MPFEGWVSYAGVEIVNVSRVAAYSGQLGTLCNCVELARGLGDAPYTRPELDPAPWYDPSIPESARFYGLMGMEIVGADTGTLTYQWTELISDGGVPGAGRRASKEVQVKAVAAAGDKAAMSYGMGWLTSALRGSACREECFGDGLCLLAACPIRPDGDTRWDPERGSTAAPGVDQLLRTAYNTTLLEAPEVTSRSTLGGLVVYEVEFTFRIGIPYWYRNPRLVAHGGGGQPPGPNVYQDIIPNYDPWNWQTTCLERATCLDEDPYCTKPPAPPDVTPLPPDPCFPNDPRNWVGSDDPYGYRFTAGRTIFSIPRGTGSAWGEKVPVFRLYTGRLPVRRLILRWYDNPTGRQCDGSLDPCRACAELNIPWLPRSAVLTFDGRTRRVTVDCPGSGPLVEPRLYGPDGGGFMWPVFECAAALCCEVIAEASSVTREMTLEVLMATREDAI